MEVRRIGDALFRSRSSPLLSFLAPSLSSTTWRATASRCPSYATLGHYAVCKRSIATGTLPLRASMSSAVEDPDQEDEHSEQTPSQPSPPYPQSSSAARNPGVNDLLHSFLKGANSPVHGSRGTPRFKSPSAQEENRRSSAAIAEQALRADLDSRNPVRRRQGEVYKAMEFGDSLSESSSSRSIMKDVSTTVSQRRNLPSIPPPVRLDAFVGRTEDVDPAKGVDLGTGLRRLDIKIAINSIKKDVFRQRFHERAGMKRKRLKSTRWRKRFKEGFRAVVAKVEDMRRRGW